MKSPLAAIFFCLSALPACAGEAQPPYEIVRSLHVLQDQMVLGNRVARAAMPSFAAQLAQRLLAFNRTVWREPRNARAAVTYVLSGGSPRVARKVLESGYCPAEDKNLLQGALAYVEGHESKAKNYLKGIDPRSLEPILGGHIALVQAALIAKDNMGDAIRLLDLARVLAPGTLVEEAALRREIFLLNATGDFDKFTAMSGEYVRRFGNSAYADNFRMHFSEALGRLEIAGTPDQLGELDDVLGGFGTNEQLQFYLLIAQSSLLNGKAGISRFAAAKAEKLAEPETPEASRAELYDGAASILTNNYERGLTQLEALDAARLSEDDRSLRQAALAVAQQIRQLPEAAGEQEQGTEMPPDLKGPMEASNAAIALAQKSLAESDALLRESRDPFLKDQAP